MESDQAREFFAQPEDYLTENSAKIAIRAALIRSMVGAASGLDIADFGCGDGTLSIQFLEEARSLYLVDGSEAMLQVARANTPEHLASKVTYEHRDLDRFDPGRQFDVVLCVGVLAHVPSVARTLDLIAGAVAAGGRCVVQVTDSSRPAQRVSDGLYALRRSLDGSRERPYRAFNTMTARQISGELQSRGLRLDGVRYYEPASFPGIGYVPADTVRGLQYAIYRRSRLARLLGVEALIAMSRPS